MSKTTKAYSKAQRLKDKRAKRRLEKTMFVKNREFGMRPVGDIILLLPDGTQKTMSYEDYKKNGKKVWASANKE